MTENSPIPVEMERFWASSKNKEKLQILSRDFFVRKSKENKEIKILLSGYVTDADVPRTCELLTDGESYEQPNPYSSIEEADSRIIPHIFEAVKNGSMRIMVLSNDTDVAVYNIAHYERFRDEGMSELWIRFGAWRQRFEIYHYTLLPKNQGFINATLSLKLMYSQGATLRAKLGQNMLH